MPRGPCWEPWRIACARLLYGRSKRSKPRSGPWPTQFRRVTGRVELAPGIALVANRDPDGAYRETPELSLVLDTPAGQVVVVGCSHPGIERILASVDAKTTPVAGIIGGLHLVTTPEAEVDRLVNALRDVWNVRAVAAGHCSGEYAFAVMRRVYGERYHYAGVGATVEFGL